MANFILAIDQGTTNSRALIFNREGKVIAQHELALSQSFPKAGWVEENPQEMLKATILCCQTVLEKAGLKAEAINAIGLTNQRETTILWDKKTGEPIYPAIVWQDRRTHVLCEQFQKNPLSLTIPQKTGLILDPYFSATKIVWILDNVKDARKRAQKGELLFGTVDSYLLWHLTKGQHLTDVTNACRTLLFNIHTQKWDEELLALFNIPATLLPQVLDNTAHFGELDPAILGKAIPITGVAGDQQAATIGQACFKAGMVKTTYGTGSFMLLNTGESCVQSKNHLLSTIIYRIQGKVSYGLEGSIFNAGTSIKWLRDTLKVLNSAKESEEIALSIKNTAGVYFIPAFTGLGAPYWDPAARGAILGLTRNTGRAEIIRAALESVAYQSQDLLKAMTADSGFAIKTMRVDGGMASNNWLLQFLSNILRLEVERPASIETTALGVAYLAGLQIGLYRSLDEIAALPRPIQRFTPLISEEERDLLYEGWEKAVQRILTT